MDRARKFLKWALTHEKFFKIHLKINKSEKSGTFFLKISIRTLYYTKLGRSTSGYQIRVEESVAVNVLEIQCRKF